MKTHCVGWQTDTANAVIITRWHRYFWGRGLAITRIYRKMPRTGTADLISPLLIEGTLWASEEAAEIQHKNLWLLLQQDALNPRIMKLLFPRNECPSPLRAEDYSRVRTTPN